MVKGMMQYVLCSSQKHSQTPNLSSHHHHLIWQWLQKLSSSSLNLLHMKQTQTYQICVMFMQKKKKRNIGKQQHRIQLGSYKDSCIVSRKPSSTSCSHPVFILNFQRHFSLFVFLSKFFQFLSSTLFFPCCCCCCTGHGTNVFRTDNKQCFEWIKRQKDTKKRTDISLIRS